MHMNEVSEPKRAVDTTAEAPWSVATLNSNLKALVGGLPTLWVIGQVVEYKPRPGTRIAFFTIRDLNASASITVKAWPNILDSAGSAFGEGARVLLEVQPDFYEGNGSISLMARSIRLEGIGSLLEQVEQLRRRLSAEGLFAPERKKRLPFLPRRIGLICGRNAKAKHDVLVNALSRWPAAVFEVREVAVQGPHTVTEVLAALAELDSMPDVDVIVIARGGGAVEDLLPFSDETLVRTAAETVTPFVSAIGHEEDAPLLDYVADYRASTPTDAARRIVPDLQSELEGLVRARERIRVGIAARVHTLQSQLDDLTARPVMRSPEATLTPHIEQLSALRTRLRSAVRGGLVTNMTMLSGTRQTLRALSPVGVLSRGYALVRTDTGTVATRVRDMDLGQRVVLQMTDGLAEAEVLRVETTDDTAEETRREKKK